MPVTGILPGLTSSDADEFESALMKFVDSRDLPLYKMMAYHLGWVDQNGEPEIVTNPVSYTHLTQPTIYSE